METGQESLKADQAGETVSDEAEITEPLSGEQESLESLAEALRKASSEEAEQEPVDEQQARIALLEQENAELKDRALRSAAEAENIRKRSERAQQDTAKFAVTGFAKDLVSVYENLIRATASITGEARKEHEGLNNLAIGVELTLKELETVFGKHHIRRIDPMGEKFDHNYHQAMMKIETDEHEAGTVLQVLQAGYVIHDRLLQPAMVGVAKPASGAASDTPHVDTQA